MFTVACGVLAVPRERFGLGPRPDDEFEVLVEPGAGLRRRDAVVEVGVVRQPDWEAAHQPAAADAVEHRLLLGDP